MNHSIQVVAPGGLVELTSQLYLTVSLKHTGFQSVAKWMQTVSCQVMISPLLGMWPFALMQENLRLPRRA
jgi:hypothetical protein